MKNLFKYNPMVSKVLQQYRKETDEATDKVRSSLHQIDVRMQNIRRFGKRSYSEDDQERINDTYDTIKDVRYLTTNHAEDITYTIHQVITDIEKGIDQINKSEAVSLLITNDEKTELINALTGLIDKLEWNQAKMDATRMEVYSYTEYILRRIHKESSHIMFVYDSESNEWHIMFGGNQEIEVKNHTATSVPKTEDTSADFKETDDTIG